MRHPFAHIGATIKMLRTKAGMLQGELADASSLTKQQISKYERGIQRPNLESLEKLMNALGINRLELDQALSEVERAGVASGELEEEAEEQERRRETRQRAILGISHAIDELVRQTVEDVLEQRER